MPSFIYSPGVQVYIQTTNKDGSEGPIYDVSDDLVSGQLIRRTNGISTFSFVLQNSGRKYDYDPVAQKPRPLFSPNDKIIVNMKRIKWVRVFTGYLNSVPVFQAWPGNISIEASCTLKRLQYYYWDPNSSASQLLIEKALLGQTTGGALATGGASGDAGLKNVALALLTNVANWDINTIHIAKIPDDWFTFALSALGSLLQNVKTADQARQAIQDAIGSAATINGGTVSSSVSGGPPGPATGVLSPGTYGGTTFTGEQLGNAETIYNVGVQKKATSQDIIRAIACSITESSLINVGHGDAVGPDSAGLFQQRPSAGWGTREQVLTPSYAAGAFFDALLRISNRAQLSDAQAIHQVQNNDASLNFRYSNNIPAATAIYNAIVKGVKNNPASASTQSMTDTQKMANLTGVPSQQDFLTQVVNLYENNQVPYQQLTGTSIGQLGSNPPAGLNAAGLVVWAFLQASGNYNNAPPVSSPSALAIFCDNNKGHKVNETDGLNTVGAVMFLGTNENTASDVQVSLGNGHQTISMTPTGLKLNEIKPGTFRFGYLLPRVAYTSIAAGDGATIATTSAGTTTTSSGNDWQPKIIPNPYTIPTDASSTSKDPIDKELISYAWKPVLNGPDVALSASLTGPRALLNDVPFMPYFTNLMTSAQRSYCSAPNGDIMAWFPDYFGWYGTAAKMHVRAIELQNFQMVWDDTNLITHYFTVGSAVTNFGIADANLSVETGSPLTQTLGIASVEDPSVMAMMFAVEPTSDQVKSFGKQFLTKFGARPQFDQLVGIYGPKGEFFTALYRFMQAWTYQFNADVPLTFMPEVWPGMLLVLDDFGFQAYVTTVTHTFNFGSGGGFNTTVNIAAPSRIGDHTPLDFINGLPVGGTHLSKPSDFIPPAEAKAADAGNQAAINQLRKSP